jgi:hypothetical protein
MKDFLDELDMEVREIKADNSASEQKTESKHLTHKLQERDEKTLKNAPDTEKPVHKKPVHNHKATG